MTLPETEAELLQLINEANARVYALREAQQAEKDAARQILEQSDVALNALLGPENAPPSVNSIRGVLAYGDATISANSAAATPLIVHGMETLTQIVIELVKVTKTKHD